MALPAPLQFDILTLFPDIFKNVFKQSLIGRAQKKRIIDIHIIDIRSFTIDKHKTVDDRPFGGGAGMVMKVEPLYAALKPYLSSKKQEKPEIILLTPQGEPFSQRIAEQLSKKKHLVLICGHYEGFDERIRTLVNREVSIGDFVLTGGEFPAMVLVDAISRMIPGTVKEKDSVENDSFFRGLLDYPQYTRPVLFRSMKVPDVLVSGHHRQIQRWRSLMSLKNTMIKRPDLFKKHTLTEEEKNIMKDIKNVRN